MRKTRKESTSFKREDVVLRYAPQRVCNAAFDADAAEEDEVDDEAAAGVFARLDAPAAVAVAEACLAFGVFGPAISFCC